MRPVPHLRFLLFLLVFAVVAALARLYLATADAIVLGFDAAALGFIGSCMPL